MIGYSQSPAVKPHEVENEKIRCLVEERLSLTRRERAETRDKLAEIDAHIKRHGDSIYATHPHPQTARVFYNSNKAQYYSYTLSGIEDEERKTAIDIRKLVQTIIFSFIVRRITFHHILLCLNRKTCMQLLHNLINLKGNLCATWKSYVYKKRL
jgi:hypothetical protein